ncbi:hypothetical protein E5Q_00910 [Mixia osmundae IAM 14324]|uniref:Uncharacterized protein n=1 Tax=Mixia osmundae (strain CBS 9802 / IAM 14324 / JCM 22182 / KY 12970) TaxID=764103 RepID=G7DUK1_MIXOS|nr:hypothetical protein E5Q_00910 [Mixia osmundae IAM 14324]
MRSLHVIFPTVPAPFARVLLRPLTSLYHKSEQAWEA